MAPVSATWLPTVETPELTIVVLIGVSASTAVSALVVLRILRR